MSKCKKCKTDMVTMSGAVYLQPDPEPYHSGEEMELDLEIERVICVEYCEKCDKLQILWESV